MSLEHKALGYRPPPGSLASEAQAAASKHPDVQSADVDATQLREAALNDAARIENERGQAAPPKASDNGIDLERIGMGTSMIVHPDVHPPYCGIYS